MRPRTAFPVLAAALAAALLVPGVAAAGGADQPIAADLNGDGLVDRATPGPQTGVPSGTPTCTISVELRKPNGTYKPAVVHSYPSPWTVQPYCPNMGEAINLARGGKTELVLTNFSRSGQPALFALKNYAVAGQFTGLGFPSTIQSADFTGDGRTDVWESSDETARLRTFTNTGAGTLVPGAIDVCSDRPVPQHVLADFNGDGGQDFLVALSCFGDQSVRVLFGNGQAPVTLATGSGTVFEVDLGGDGIPDAGVVTSTGTRYFHNNGHGVFTETTPLVAPAPPHVPSNAATAAQQARFSHR